MNGNGTRAAKGERARILGERIFALRDAHGWTLQHVCDELTLTKGHLSLVERGQVVPSVFIVADLAKLFGVSVDALLSPREKDTRRRRTAQAKDPR